MRPTDLSTTKATKSTKESENETLDAIFKPGVIKLVNLEGTSNRAIGKVVEFHLRALRVLRGNTLPIFAAERLRSLSRDEQRASRQPITSNVVELEW